MPWYNADLHIHTCLSPCGSLEMSPRRIIGRAWERGLQLIAITDHNSTRNVRVCMECGAAEGISVIPGCEVNTQEEVHSLCYFPHMEAVELFQDYLDRQISDIPNDPKRFGYQVVVSRSYVMNPVRFSSGSMTGLKRLKRWCTGLGDSSCRRTSTDR
jgi:PHP family Zn ribbon phosphoesterase